MVTKYFQKKKNIEKLKIMRFSINGFWLAVSQPINIAGKIMSALVELIQPVSREWKIALNCILQVTLLVFQTCFCFQFSLQTEPPGKNYIFNLLSFLMIRF